MIASPAAGVRRELDKNRIRRENASGAAGISQILVTIQLMKLLGKTNVQRPTPNAQRPSQAETRTRGEDSLNAAQSHYTNKGMWSQCLRPKMRMCKSGSLLET